MRYADHGIDHVGTYEVDGWMLELSSCYGTLRVPLGLFEAKALARKLLRHLVRKVGPDVAGQVPHPVAIVAAKPAAPIMRVPKL